MNETRYRLQHLRAWREFRELSQADLAEASGVGKATIARLEGEKNEANGTTVNKLARGLVISRDMLLNEDPYNNNAARDATTSSGVSGEVLTNERQTT
jgi:transcriptional regulator with XRE-family HTH domain